MIRYFVLSLLILFSQIAYPNPIFTLNMEVARVIDGDTIASKDDVRIRLANIDAPEKRMYFGTESTQYLSKLILGKVVTIKVTNVGKYGRFIGTVYLGDTNINMLMVCKGYAFAYRKYLTDKSYLDCEKEARKNKLGVWATEKYVIYPWVYRKIQRDKNFPGKLHSGLRCDNLEYPNCLSVGSCKDAAALSTCGGSHFDDFDRDKDGMPCEAVRCPIKW